MLHRFRSGAVAVLAVIMAASSIAAGPKIKFSESNYSFGKVTQHEILTKRFWIKSVGDKTARITEALQDCSCTELMLKDSTVAPGDSVPLDVSLNTRNFIGFVNKRSHYLVEGSGDTTYLMLYAEVLVKSAEAKPVTLLPDRVDVSQFTVKPRRRSVFTLTNNSSADLEISIVDTTAKSFEVEVPKVIKAGGKVEGVVMVKKDRIPNSFAESFALELNDDGRTRYSVPIVRMYQVKDSSAATSR